MTNPTGAPAVNGSQRPPTAPPPNPKQQAVTFALELAKIRATLPGASANRGTDVKQLIADATEIAAFIGQPTATRAFGGEVSDSRPPVSTIHWFRRKEKPRISLVRQGSAVDRPADYHEGAHEWDDPHRRLLEELLDAYDGFAIATSPTALPLMESCQPRAESWRGSSPMRNRGRIGSVVRGSRLLCTRPSAVEVIAMVLALSVAC
jgi:hypothetical protein